MRQIKEYPLKIEPQQTVTLPADGTFLTLAEKGGVPVLCMRETVCEGGTVGGPDKLKDYTVEMVNSGKTYDMIIGDPIGTIYVAGVLYHFFMHYLNPALDRVHKIPGDCQT